ncbi:MAG TPA: polyprenyl synthetase family protein [Anaerolineales bacterium]|nr:polyprenyl synthetase family protein [Anaerolineales bacterium]
MSATTFFTSVQDQLQFVERRIREQAGAEHHPDLRSALDHLLAAGGKRIRPTLGLLVGNMLGAPEEKLITLGASVEMLHTATLVHDDLIDGALLRRGMPTLNARWSPAATVLTGDFLFARAAKLAAETDYLPLMKLFADTLATIVNGELTQMFSARGVIDRENYYQRIYSKTASLFEMSALAASMVATEDEEMRASMKTFGYEVGFAFQIVDDILDFTGEQSAVGKPIGSDLLNGLVTLPAIYYAEINPHDEDILSLPEGGWKDTERVHRLVDGIRQSEAIQQAMREVRSAVHRALSALEDAPETPEKEALDNLARFIVNRKV